VTDTFPRQFARTQRFTLGEPRNITVSGDGRRVLFLRSASGSDPINSLWVLDTKTGEERLIADPRVLLSSTDDDELPPEERARRERLREGAGGITAYATDAKSSVVAFALAGKLFVAGVISGQARLLHVDGPVFDPSPDPMARRVAYVSGNSLCLGELDGTSRVLAGEGSAGPDEQPPDSRQNVSWGSADFIAAEEMHRFRGYWWSPDGTSIAACRVDESPVTEWVIADPANPDDPARKIRYPAAGSPNADVTLHLLGLDGTRVSVDWDRKNFPYVASVTWSVAGLVILVQTRDQRGSLILHVDPETGATAAASRDHDDAWVELVPGTPTLLSDGRVVSCADRDGARRLMIDGTAITPPDLQVRSVLSTNSGQITFQANPIDDATQLHVFRWTPEEIPASDDIITVEGELRALTNTPGVYGAVVGGTTTVIRSATLTDGSAHTSTTDGHTILSFAETPLVTPNINLFKAGMRDLATAVLLPHNHDGSQLPVLLDPYGGPHALRVTQSRNSYLTSQWFADQGFAVVVTDGRGTPGRGSDWERSVHNDLATNPLDDQIDALHDAAKRFDVLDLERVAIRGWSFGGYLAALAVIKRPDVFHAAIAGAPVTEWRLYDTHYTERYLGDPDANPEAYDRSSLLPIAADLTRPLLLIHGLADDNVVAAHTLQLSSALLAAGRPHEVLPLVGVTHITPQEIVAENLLLHQLEFLLRSLTNVAVASDGSTIRSGKDT
jgi:dipeptidyl-peptidase-4